MTDLPAAPSPSPAPPAGAAPAKSTKGRLILRIVLVAVLVLFGGYGIATCSGVRRVNAIAEGLPSKFAEARARKGDRPVLRGEAKPGNAFDDYAGPLGELKGVRDDGNALSTFVSRSPGADAAKVELILQRYGALVDRLRSGASRGSAQYPYVWEQGFTMELPPVLACQMLGNLAVVKARRAAEAGQAREAAELLLDVGMFGRDLCHNAPLISGMIGVAQLNLAAEELRDVVLSGKLAEGDRAEIARQLRVLDGCLEGTGDLFRNEAMGFQSALTGGVRLEPIGGGMPGWLESWSYGFVPSLMYADAAREYERILGPFAEASAKPWEEVQKMDDRAKEEVQRHGNVVIRIAVPGLLGAERSYREARARLRLVRAALGEADLEDPFGGKIRRGEGKFWSVGSNGKDDGGAGDWKDPTREKDIVLEAKK